MPRTQKPFTLIVLDQTSEIEYGVLESLHSREENSIIVCSIDEAKEQLLTSTSFDNVVLFSPACNQFSNLELIKFS